MTFQEIKRLVERNDTRWGRVFDLVIQMLIVVSLVSFTIDTLPDLSPVSKRVLEIIELVTVVVCTFGKNGRN